MVAATDADCRVEPGWIAAIQEAFSDPEVVETYGPLEFFDGPLFDRLLSRYGYPLFLGLMLSWASPTPPGATTQYAGRWPSRWAVTTYPSAKTCG